METRERRCSARGRSRPAPLITEKTLPHVPSAVRARNLQDAKEVDLVSIFLDGEERAFNEIVRRYQARIFYFVYRTLLDRERSEDLVQEVFIRVSRHLYNFDRSKKFSTWIYTIASNLVKNELRNRSRHPLVLFTSLRMSGSESDEELSLQFEDVRTGPERLLELRDLRVLVDYGISRMSTPNHREVFILREVDGLSYEEISRMLGVNLGTVKSRLNRARNAFAVIVGPHLR